jgi:hypothetical protein
MAGTREAEYRGASVSGQSGDGGNPRGGILAGDAESVNSRGPGNPRGGISERVK